MSRYFAVDTGSPNVNPLQARMIGYGGDEFISDTSTKVGPYSHIYVTADAVISEIKIDGVSCLSESGYSGKTLPQGYLICAGADQKIDHIKLTSGSVEGFRFYV
jgi:hypothetical protein